MPKTGLTADEIRDRAIEITIDLMREHGFGKVRLIDVARELGVSHAALYAHFADKEALLDAVSERWIRHIDAALDELCQKAKDPVVLIREWMLTLHRLKREKVLNDPELYKAFDMAADQAKPFIQEHLKNSRYQLTQLVKAAQADGKLTKYSVNKTLDILQAATMSFHHPKLVAQFLDHDRTRLLKRVLDVTLEGLG